MIDKKHHIKKTEQAWNRLYIRLEKEEQLTGPAQNRIYRRGIGWAVVIAGIIFVSLITDYLVIKNPEKESHMLTQRNEELSTTLVTTLEDGSIVYLAGETSLLYPEHFSADRRTVKLEGSAMFDVAGNRLRPFIIETANSRIKVLGTAFNVKSKGKSPYELSVQRGEVKVILKKNGQETHVRAGETVILHPKRLQISRTTDNRQFLSYTEKIRFKDEKLGNILRVINKQSALKKITADPVLEERILTVAFSNCEPQAVAGLLCTALSLQASQKGDTILLSEQPDR